MLAVALHVLFTKKGVIIFTEECTVVLVNVCELVKLAFLAISLMALSYKAFFEQPPIPQM